MIQKFTYGNPIKTDSIVENIPASDKTIPFGIISAENNFSYTLNLAKDDIVYGLGEANRGINKRGYKYISNCFDIPHHTEEQLSLYGAHNFIIIDGESCFGLYFDYPSYLTFDIGYTESDKMSVTCENADLDIYYISGASAYDVTKQFLSIIGRSYIPPFFAFGFGQSRWGYVTEKDFKDVATNYRKNNIPLDMIYMDIDYMDHYKDFTVNKENFPDFKGFVNDMKSDHIHLVPIIDAGVKIEKGYEIYDEGVENGYFCKREDGTDFEAAVWPGMTHFPDVLNKNAREWFGDKYKYLLDQGIDGFWNDMCEPAIFYTKEGLANCKEYLKDNFISKDNFNFFEVRDSVMHLSNNDDDYKRFYHNMDGEMIRHDKVHNLYGFNMTRSAAEGIAKNRPGKRTLLFSRSSFIGAHRYGGIWTGDNCSYWSHILLNLKMLPSLNMCGFLYCGADLGGFGANTTRDLLLRWLALGVFTPLMRNHAALGTRNQECYAFENTDDFKHVIEVRYRLLPYIYSEFMKAALSNDMLFRPLAFDYPNDKMASQIEDQLMMGKEIMIAPVYTQNVTGRYVYLPEEMMFVKFKKDNTISTEILSAGHHYVNIDLTDVPLFIKKDCNIPVCEPAACTDLIDYNTISYIGYDNYSYDLYQDDGITAIE